MAGTKRQVCRCVRVAQLQHVYPFLRAVDFTKVNVPSLQKALTPLLGTGRVPDLCIRCEYSEHEIYVMLALLLIHYQVRMFRLLNVYELIEIFLRNHPTITSIFSIHDPVTCLLMGFNEFENKRQEDIIRQFIDNSRMNGRRTILVARPKEISTALFDSITAYLRDRGFQFADYKTVPTKRGSLYSQ